MNKKKINLFFFKFANSNASCLIESAINRMNEPLQKLFLSSSNQSVSFSSSTGLLSTRSIEHPIDLIISDILIHTSIQYTHQKHIPVYFFVPNSLMFIMRYINISMGNVENSIVTQNFAHQVIEALSSAKGLICNSIYQFDKQVLDELRHKSFPGSDLSIRFVAPLMSQLDEHENVSI